MRAFAAAAAALLSATTATSTSPSPHADRDHGRIQAQDAIAIFVDRHSPPGGDGSRRTPYQAIARALELAREIRTRSRAPIVVHVAPGEYVEEFPLYLDVSQLELRGTTQLIEDKDGLPRNCGTVTVASPCIEPGSETVIAPATPLATGQVLLAIAPTIDSPSDRVSDVTVQGFVVDGKAANVAASGSGVFIDRTEGFWLRGNVIKRVQVGILARLSSGTIRGQFAYDNNDALAIGGGSRIYPATVDVFGNRLTNNRSQGAIAVGAGGVRSMQMTPAIKPVQRVYDRSERPEEVPDELAITVRYNDISGNTSFGFRFESFSANNSFYDTVGTQPMTAYTKALVRGNSFVNNGEYGVTVEGAFATRSNPRVFTARFEGRFEDNDFAYNGRGALFAGFMLNGVVTRNPGLITMNKYLKNSTFAIEADNRLVDIDYDNPRVEPLDRTTLLNNVLTINGTSIVGTRVTCPPGFPCVP